MKNLIILLCLSLVLFLAQLIFPWWIIMPICVITGYLFMESYGASFLIGIIGAGLPWLVLSLLEWSNSNGIMADKIGQMVGGVPGVGLVLIVALFAGILGALATCTGYSIKRLFIKE